MRIDVAAVRQCLKAFDFRTLFREHLGWDNHQAQLDVPVGGAIVSLSAIAQKRGFVAFVCPQIPDRATRLKIDHQVTKSAREHFVVYADEGTGQQVWQWVRREPGKPLASRDHRFEVSQSGDPLIQRLDQLAVSMEEEETITVVDVAGRARAAFDVDKVTKKFYDRFKTEHAAFQKLVTGIASNADLQWYTSLMLNRLMFVYFIQKKGFLDGDTDYLRGRLALVREARGKDEFQSFYRYFLLRLFHDGLGKSPSERELDPEMERLLGDVPFLNGGFFEVHQLEERNDGIDIPDRAFEKLFDFFDQYRWHLDERPLRADNEINPDVVGYIFEKYINQKQMGAYYTKEDITEYISKNTIIPFLFDAAAQKCPIAFEPDSALWRLLREDPDRYIYAAVRHGVIDEHGNVIPLPDEIAAGVSDPAARTGWNVSASDPYALPAETWREHVARRERCLDLRAKLCNGEVCQINDLVTLNLDVWQFARDAIVNAEGPELLRAFWYAIEKVTVLDPTCGSGAFLFAALRILETLYSDCLERMAQFIEDAEHAAPSTAEKEVRGLIAAGESATVEFKASARWDIKEDRYNPDLEAVIVKTVAGFLNAHGGTLLIGVSDHGVVLGLERDYERTNRHNPSRDQFELWLTNHLMKHLGREAKPCFHVDFADCDGMDVCRVGTYRSARPVFVTRKGQETLYVRQGNATNPYTKASEILAYTEQHWPADQAVPPPPPPPSASGTGPSGKAAKAKRVYGDFRETLAQIEEHPSERYFVLKSIIINNLFGVDIMAEAVEICKLRLFLKLVAQVQAVEQIEPLPDIDFNIRAGNTLVGFASLAQVKESMQGDMLKLLELPRIEESAEMVARAFRQFRAQQTTHGGKVTHEDKLELRNRLQALDVELDRYLAAEYGITENAYRKEGAYESAFAKWRSSHEPFHWFVEFYEIMNGGGFDVIIGNPPYVVYSEARVGYGLRPGAYRTYACKNLYGYAFERSIALASGHGLVGLIVQLTAMSAEKMACLQDLLLGRGSCLSLPFPRRPESMFAGVEMPVSIQISSPGREGLWTSRINRFYTEERPSALHTLRLQRHKLRVHGHRVAKLGTQTATAVLGKLLSIDTRIDTLTAKGSEHLLYYQEACRYWVKASKGYPRFRRNGQAMPPPHGRILPMVSESACAFAACLLNSSLFYWLYSSLSDCEHINDSLVRWFPIPSGLPGEQWVDLWDRLASSLEENATPKTIRTKQGHVIQYDEMKAALSKPIIDEIDTVLAKHYGFTDEELDFIINYDLKYRMGGAVEDD